MRMIRTTKLKNLELRLVEMGKASYVGVIFASDGEKARIEGDKADDVWRRLHDEAGKADPRYAGFDGARARFLRFFPGGFQSQTYLDTERNYKLAAKEKLDRDAPLAKALDGTGFGEAALAAFRGTNLLSRFEKTRLQALLRGPDADMFVRAAARFTEGDRSTLLDMERALRPHDNAKWTVVTYLPFLWRPDVHMILKPQSTTDFAARVGHSFANDYEARLEIGTYDSLLDLVSVTERELADLQPRDRIDVQSFIWVIGSYKEEDLPKQALPADE